jgi:hypothetical protein
MVEVELSKQESLAMPRVVLFTPQLASDLERISRGRLFSSKKDEPKVLEFKGGHIAFNVSVHPSLNLPQEKMSFLRLYMRNEKGYAKNVDFDLSHAQVILDDRSATFLIPCLEEESKVGHFSWIKLTNKGIGNLRTDRMENLPPPLRFAAQHYVNRQE